MISCAGAGKVPFSPHSRLYFDRRSANLHPTGLVAGPLSAAGSPFKTRSRFRSGGAIRQTSHGRHRDSASAALPTLSPGLL